MTAPTDIAPVVPSSLAQQDGSSYPRLIEIMRRLLGPDGCPWDRVQTFETLRRYLQEEAGEAIDALDSGDRPALCDELGDLLLQVAFLGELARAEGAFGPDDVIAGIVAKLRRRHPHVFGEERATGPDQVIDTWERIKAAERKAHPGATGVLSGVARSLPSLARAQRVGEKVARVGFDWPDVEGSRAKVDEELGELDAAIAAGSPERIEAELGDVIFALVNLARHLSVDADGALRRTVTKFVRRFEHVEARVVERHGGWPAHGTLSLAELDGYWEEAKRERGALGLGREQDDREGER